MAHPLDGADTRVARAREHFELVEREWNALPPDAKAITLGSEYKSDTQKIEVKIASVPAIDQRWSLELSECLFNLRCALNYLTWELAKWNLAKKGETREPSRQTQYPLTTAEDQFPDRQVKDLHSNHVTIIKWLQPYSPLYMTQFTGPILLGANPEGLANQHPALRLQELDNADKHRLLEVSAIGPHVTRVGEFTAFDCEVANPNFFMQAGTFQVGTKWAEFDVVSVTGPDPRVEMPAEVEPSLTFAGYPILLGYAEIERYVRGALETFRSVF
jgi:hypothetical protein